MRETSHEQNRLKTATSDLQDICLRAAAFIEAEPEKRDQHFDALAFDLFAFQYEMNPAYQAFCRYQGKTPFTVRRLQELPAIVTSAFKEADLTVLRPEQRTTVFHSSGTTEHRPSRQFHSTDTLQVYERSLLAGFKPHVLPDRKQAAFLILSPRPEKVPHSSLAHMFGALQREFGRDYTRYVGQVSSDGSWLLDFSKLEEACFELSQCAESVVICGTAFSFVHWCDWLGSKRIRFPAGSRVFETGGYKGRSRAVPKDELHQLIEQAFSIPKTHIISEYGMSELSSQAYDRVAGVAAEPVFRFAPWARAMIVSPETGAEVEDGEPGLVKVYDLANVGSVVAVQTQDLATKREDGFVLIGRAALAEARGCSLLHR